MSEPTATEHPEFLVPESRCPCESCKSKRQQTATLLAENTAFRQANEELTKRNREHHRDKHALNEKVTRLEFELARLRKPIAVVGMGEANVGNVRTVTTKEEYEQLMGHPAPREIFEKNPVLFHEIQKPTVRFKKTHPDAIAPRRAKPGDAGLDLYASEDVTIEYGRRVYVGTGIAFEIPPDFEGSVRGRSGNSGKSHDVALGLVDESYRGEVRVLCCNNDADCRPWEIKRGDRIGQIVIAPYLRAELVEADELSATDRGAAGFGSTGDR